MARTHLVVMGVSGCGKSSVAQRLRDMLGWPMAEGDDLHPQANIVKMSAGTALSDEDRWPWLDAITEWTTQQDEAGYDTIVTCSALRRVYRDRLRRAPGRTVFLHLDGAEALLAERLAPRTGHFMPPSLLPSQLATLEALDAAEDGIVLDIAEPISAIAEQAISRLALTE